jgi:serine/threonine protein kinase
VDRHPNVVPVLDHWLDEHGHLNIVLEWVEGGDLTRHVNTLRARANFALPTALKLMADLAQGLAFVHSVGTWHRDIKPDNVLVTRGGRALLSDFGLARAGASGGGGVGIARGGGSPLYTAPEVLDGKPFTAAADVWALGVVCFQLAVGDLSAGGWPFHDPLQGDAMSITRLVACLSARSPDWSRLPAGCPPELRAVLAAMLSKPPAGRPTAARVVAQLLLAMEGSATGGGR